MESTRNFKIRKTGSKLKSFQEMQDQELVATLEDLRLAEQNDLEQTNIRSIAFETFR